MLSSLSCCRYNSTARNINGPIRCPSLTTPIIVGSPEILQLVSFSAPSWLNTEGLPHSSGRVPDTGLESTSKKSKEGIDPLVPHKAGRVPVMCVAWICRLCSAGKAPRFAQDSGIVPAQQNVRSLPSFAYIWKLQPKPKRQQRQASCAI